MNLKKINSVFPEFCIGNFNIFDKIVFLKWETIFDCNSCEDHTNLLLEMTCPAGFKILMEFIDVSSWRFQGNGQVSGFYIKDMTARGYENASKYEVGDYEEGKIEFYCSDIVVKDFKKAI